MAREGIHDLAVVGGGASGALLLLQLLARARRPLRIAWFDADGAFARGLAYGAAEPVHLLNVPAAKMSAFADRPDHFLAWCRGRGIAVDEGDFVPRLIWGDYLEQTLAAARQAAFPGVEVASWQRRVEAIEPEGAGWRLRCDDRQFAAEQVVLACGHGVRCGGLLASPWDRAALDAAAGDGAVLLLGTGLTMIDAVLSLRERGHRGPLLGLSRHGLLPRAHGEQGRSMAMEPPRGRTARQLLREVRTRAERVGDWRAIVDALRPHTATLWQRLPPEEKRRFLRHLRIYWEVHRHRVPRRIEAVLARAPLEVRAGRLLDLARDGEGLVARWRQRGEAQLREARFAAAFDCTGSACSVEEVPLLRRLVEAGVARPDPLGLGLQTEDGRVAPGIWAIGPMRRGELYESTAIPEIRLQARELAEGLLAAATAGREAVLC